MTTVVTDSMVQLREQPRPQTTATVTFVGLVRTSYTAERFCDCATMASISFFGRVGVDVKGDLDVVVSVAHVPVDAENALDVHRAFELRLDRPQLHATILGNRGHAGRQTACESDEHVFNRRHAEVFGRENLRMIRVERELGLVLLFLAEPVEVLVFSCGYGCRSAICRTPAT